MIMPRIESPSLLESYRDSLLKERGGYSVSVSLCGGTGCHAHNCGAVFEAFKAALEKKELTDTVELKMTGCHGFCEMGPLMVIQPAGIFYKKVSPDDIEVIIEKSILGDEIIPGLVYQDPADGRPIELEIDIPFYRKQKRILMGMNGKIDPCNIDDYIAQGGYTALVKALFEMKPVEIIDEVEKAGLRGRGGAGFSAANKWRACRKAVALDDIKYVLCNADEGTREPIWTAAFSRAIPTPFSRGWS